MRSFPSLNIPFPSFPSLHIPSHPFHRHFLIYVFISKYNTPEAYWVCPCHLPHTILCCSRAYLTTACNPKLSTWPSPFNPFQLSTRSQKAQKQTKPLFDFLSFPKEINPIPNPHIFIKDILCGVSYIATPKSHPQLRCMYPTLLYK